MELTVKPGPTPTRAIHSTPRYFIIGRGHCSGQQHIWWFVGLYAVLYLLILRAVMFAKPRRDQLFSREFAEYNRKVPLFLPRLTPYRSLPAIQRDGERRFSWPQYLKASRIPRRPRRRCRYRHTCGEVPLVVAKS